MCQEFISAGVNAYALGCTDEGLRKELTAMKESSVEIEAMQSYGGSTSVKSKISAEEVSWSSLLLCITVMFFELSMNQLYWHQSKASLQCRFFWLGHNKALKFCLVNVPRLQQGYP